MKNEHNSMTVFRLQTGHCRLNHHLLRLNLHQTGLMLEMLCSWKYWTFSVTLFKI